MLEEVGDAYQWSIFGRCMLLWEVTVSRYPGISGPAAMEFQQLSGQGFLGLPQWGISIIGT